MTDAPDLGVGGEARAEELLHARHGGGRAALEDQHQLGQVRGGPHQAPAVVEGHARAVDVVDAAGELALHRRQHTLHHLVLDLVGAVHVDLGAGHVLGRLREHPRERQRLAGEILGQLEPAEQAVVVAVEAVLQEEVPAALARDGRAHLGHLGLDPRVAGLPHDGPAAVGQDVLGQRLAALDVEDHRRAGVARQDRAREQHQDPVALDVLSALVLHAHAVAVAVEGESQVGLVLDHGLADRRAGRLLAGVGEVVGEGRVGRAEERHHRQACTPVDLLAEERRGAVAGVEHDLERPGEAHPPDEVGDVGGTQVKLLDAARPHVEGTLVGDALEALDVRLEQRLDAVHRHLEAAPALGIVARRDHHAREAGQVHLCEVERGREHAPDVHHVEARGAQALHEALLEAQAVGPEVVAHHHALAAALVGQGPEGPPERARALVAELVDGLGEDLGHAAAHVILAEHRRLEAHGFRLHGFGLHGFGLHGFGLHGFGLHGFGLHGFGLSRVPLSAAQARA